MLFLQETRYVQCRRTLLNSSFSKLFEKTTDTNVESELNQVNLSKFDLIYYEDYLEIIVNEFQNAEFFLDSLLIVRNFIQ